LNKIEVDVEVNYKGINDRLDRIVKHAVTLIEERINENHTTIFGIAKKLEERINENHTNLQLWATNITTHLNNRR